LLSLDFKPDSPEEIHSIYLACSPFLGPGIMGIRGAVVH
jgi:hypothetical protein